MRIITFTSLSTTQQGGFLARRHTNVSNSTAGVLGLLRLLPGYSTFNHGKYYHAPYLCWRSIRSVRNVRSRGAGRRSRDSIHRTGSQADIQQEQASLSLSRDLIRQADLENYRDQIEPTTKPTIAEIDDIEPNFRKSRRLIRV